MTEHDSRPFAPSDFSTRSLAARTGCGLLVVSHVRASPISFPGPAGLPSSSSRERSAWKRMVAADCLAAAGPRLPVVRQSRGIRISLGSGALRRRRAFVEVVLTRAQRPPRKRSRACSSSRPCGHACVEICFCVRNARSVGTFVSLSPVALYATGQYRSRALQPTSSRAVARAACQTERVAGALLFHSLD